MQKGIIQKLNEISANEKTNFFHISGKHSEKSNPVDVLLENNKKIWWLGSEPIPSFNITIKDGFGIHLTHILIKSGDSNFPKSWKVEALYNSISYEIDKHTNETIFLSNFTSVIFNITQGFYTSFKFTMTGSNSNGYNTFCLNYIDFYGFLTDSNGKIIIFAPYFKYVHITYQHKIIKCNSVISVILSLIILK